MKKFRDELEELEYWNRLQLRGLKKFLRKKKYNFESDLVKVGLASDLYFYKKKDFEELCDGRVRFVVDGVDSMFYVIEYEGLFVVIEEVLVGRYRVRLIFCNSDIDICNEFVLFYVRNIIDGVVVVDYNQPPGEVRMPVFNLKI